MSRVLVGGCGGAASVGFVKSLRKTGDEFYFVGTDANLFSLAFSETDVNYLVPKASESNYIDTLNDIIEKEKIEFVHSQPDPEIAVISKNRDRINAKTFLPNHETIEICQDKYLSHVKWREHGLEMPKTIFIENEDHLEQAFQEIETPFWIRATKGAGGKGSIIVKDPKQAKAWIDYWNGWGIFVASELLTQRLVTWQSIWHEGELVCAQSRERLSWALSHTSASGVSGMTGVGVTIDREDVDEIAQKAILAVDKKPHGIFGVDMKENKKGTPCPTEINIGRFFTTVQFFAELGLNMPDIYLKIGLHGKVPKIKKKINPLPVNRFWIRSADAEPVLMTMDELKKLSKNSTDIESLIKPDSSVKYNV